MSAERLREAAKWMRKRAERAPEGPYGMSSQWTTPATMSSRVTAGGGKIIAEVRERSEFVGVYTVDYLSRMDPTVTLAVADWLDFVAAGREALDGLAANQRIVNGTASSNPLAHAPAPASQLFVDTEARALAVADAYLGSSDA